MAVDAGLPEPFMSGTWTYVVLTVLAVMTGYVGKFTGVMTKENASVFSTLAFVTGVCLWMLWACAYLHQWNLLIMPIKSTE